MKKYLTAALAAMLALSLIACETIPAGQPPAPLNQTVLDEKAIITALSAYDVVLTAVDALVAAKVLVPGSPKALQVRQALVTARDALKTASAAQRAGSATTYAEAIAQATVAFNGVKTLLKGN